MKSGEAVKVVRHENPQGLIFTGFFDFIKWCLFYTIGKTNSTRNVEAPQSLKQKKHETCSWKIILDIHLNFL
jgi:hypothetical protein